MLNKRIITHFTESIEAKIEAAEVLAPVISEAAFIMVRCLIGDKKIIACGSGTSACNAQHFVTSLINQFQYDRPGLPAIALNSDGNSLSSIAQTCGYHDVLSKQIRALGQPDDILISLSTNSTSEPSSMQAIRAAHDREMNVVAITNGDGGDLARLLGCEDIEIRIPCNNHIRAFEIQTLITHCLCDLIEVHLFGNIDEE